MLRKRIWWLFGITLGLALLALLLHQANRPWTPAQVIRWGASLNGRRVTIRGRVEQVRPICTEVFCGPENPCCNACYAMLGFQETGGVIFLIGGDFQCTGNGCGLSCTPVEPGQEIAVTGILKRTLPYEMELNVETFEIVK